MNELEGQERAATSVPLNTFEPPRGNNKRAKKARLNFLDKDAALDGAGNPLGKPLRRRSENCAKKIARTPPGGRFAVAALIDPVSRGVYEEAPEIVNHALQFSD